MKKVFAILLLALMVLSIVPAFAAENTTSSNDNESVNANNTMNSGSSTSSRAIEENNKVVSVPKPKRLRPVAKLGKRLIAKKAKIKARAVERAKAVRAFKEELRNCKFKSDDACKKVKEDAKKKAYRFLFNSVDRGMALLEKAKERIDNSKLSDEEKSAALSRIDSKIKELNNVKTELAGKDEINRKELREIAGKVRKSWNDVKKAISTKLHTVFIRRFGNIVVKLEKVKTKLSDKITKLESNGVDVSQVSTELFNEKVDEAKAAYDRARALFDKAKTESEKDAAKELRAQAREKLRESHEALKAAREELKSIIKQLRESVKNSKKETEDLKAEE
ncbi:hypothetical protein DRJ25_05730 [Candidatus Woesearchaeota archaeon]|nr:MAG: hypothetical protein DRJ25_05730 [Candidatus Woesearchaeota archaeon]